jgi:hypothetical protein
MLVFMRRILPASLALVLLSAPAVRAQTCQGLPDFSAAQVQVNGEASLTTESNAIGGGLSAGFPSGPFGQVSLASRTHQDFGRSSLDIGAATGYEVALGQGSRVHLCPVLAGALQLGPNNAFNSDVQRLSQSARIGLSVGTELAPFRRWNVVPAFALSYAYERDEAKDQAGAVLFRIQDYYTLAQLGIGFIYKSTFSLRPYVDLPLWLDGGVPSVGVMVGYGLGRRSQ